MWAVTITSNKTLSNKKRNLIVEYINSETHNVIKQKYFILHDVLEGRKYLEAIIEGNKLAVLNLLSILKANLPYRISYKKIY